MNIYESFIENSREFPKNQGKLIYSGRNQIKVFSTGDLLINVKRYGVPSLFNRIIYSYFQPSKVLELLPIHKCC